MHDFFINAISDESNLFVNESENMQGFFGRQVLSIWLFLTKWNILPDSIAVWMETNMPCDRLKPIGLRENLVVSYCA